MNKCFRDFVYVLRRGEVLIICLLAMVKCGPE